MPLIQLGLFLWLIELTAEETKRLFATGHGLVVRLYAFAVESGPILLSAYGASVSLAQALEAT